MAETRQEDIASQGCGTVGSGSRDVANVNATAALSKGDLGVWHYRGWIITSDDFGGGWTAYSEDYDAEWLGEEDGYADNGQKVSAQSLEACCDEIDAWIDEADEAERAEERANHDGGDA